MHDEIVRFIEASRASGLSEDVALKLLEDAGWSRKEIYVALREHYERVSGVAVPARRGSSEGARDAFLHLLSFGTLIAWIVALGSLLFAFIERMLPDPVMPVRYGGLGAHELATLFVTFPVYLMVQRTVYSEMRRTPEKAHSPVRRWLTWLALLIASSVVIGDLIAVLASALRGEITARFLLKAFVVLVLAGGVFLFYLRSLQAGVPSRSLTRRFAALAMVGVLAGVLGGFVAFGPPQQQRRVQADARRIEHLRTLDREIALRGETPVSLADLRSKAVDPVTGEPYEYRRLDDQRYELCAVFEAGSEDNQTWTDPLWAFKAGRQCFTLAIDRRRTGAAPVARP